MTNFIMMIGIAGSGKSYHAAILAQKYNAIVVSSDAIRGELYGDENDQTHNTEVFEEVHCRILTALRNGQSAIYDATNLSAKRRKTFLKNVPAGITKIAVVVATDLEICWRQNGSRDRQVPPDVIKSMLIRLQMPTFEEGWNDIQYISNTKNESDLVNVITPCVGYDQDNPHHTNLLFDHMLEAAEYVASHSKKYNFTDQEVALVYVAALFHDIGKPLCKTYTLFSGKVDDCAHYYNHAQVGAYMIACLLRSVPTEDYSLWIKILRLIQYHMDAYSHDNFLEKVSAIEGERFGQMLALLHEGDLNAH